MNKKLEAIQKEVAGIYEARYAKLAKIEEQIHAIENEIPQCDEGMKAAVVENDLDMFEKLGTRKAFLQNRKALFKDALNEAQKGTFSKADYSRLKQKILAVIYEDTENTKKELVKYSAIMGKLGDDLRAEADTARDLINTIAEWAGATDHVAFDATISTCRWAFGVQRNPMYNNAVTEHPEWVPKK